MDVRRAVCWITQGTGWKKGVVLLKTDTTGFKFLNKYFTVFKIISNVPSIISLQVKGYKNSTEFIDYKVQIPIMAAIVDA